MSFRFLKTLPIFLLRPQSAEVWPAKSARYLCNVLGKGEEKAPSWRDNIYQKEQYFCSYHFCFCNQLSLLSTEGNNLHILIIEPLPLMVRYI